MRILVVTSGCDRSELALYEGWVRAGQCVDLVCEPAMPRQDALRRAGIRVDHHAIRHRLDIQAIKYLRNRLRTHDYDILYAPRNHSLSVSLLASRGMKVKRVAYRGTSGHLSRLDPASWLTYLNPGIHAVICVSHAVRRYLLTMGIPPKRLATIYKGHDISWYAEARSPDLTAFNIPEKAFIVGFIGNMRPVKSVDVLIQSALHLPPSSPVHFLLVGKVQDKRIPKLAGDPRIRSRIHLAGFLPNAAAMAKAFHVFVMPSAKREGLPRAVIEAMAQGVPAIVTDVGGMPEIVDHGASGLVVPPRDPRALAQAIASLSQDAVRCRQIGEKARKRIQEHFNIRDTISETIDLFHRLADER